MIQTAKFFVVEQNGLPLLGLETATRFGVLHIKIPTATTTIANVDAETVEGKPLIKIKGVIIKLPIDESVKPVIQPYRRIPVQLEQPVERKLKQLLDEDIIEPVNGTSEWISPMIVVPQGSGDEVRICLDMRRANLAIKRENYPLPVIDDFLPHMNGAKYFSKLDIRNASGTGSRIQAYYNIYHQARLIPFQAFKF